MLAFLAATGVTVAEMILMRIPAPYTTGLFGGNSNWRGPIWMPVNSLILHAFFIRTFQGLFED